MGFILYGSASRVVLRCVLMQHGKVVAYVCRKLKLHERNYQTNDVALVVILENIWRHSFYGVYVDVYTDHKVSSMILLKRC